MFTSSSAKTASCGKPVIELHRIPEVGRRFSPPLRRSSEGLRLACTSSASTVGPSSTGGIYRTILEFFDRSLRRFFRGALDRVDDEIVRQNGRASPPPPPPPRRPRDDAAVPRIAPASALRNAMLLLVATNKTKRERECSSFFYGRQRRRREEYSFSYCGMVYRSSTTRGLIRIIRIRRTTPPLIALFFHPILF